MNKIINELPTLPENSRLICELKGHEKCLGYAVDINGNVWTCKSNTKMAFKGHWRVLALKNNVHGYPFFIMSNFGHDITARIHRILALAFIPNPDNLPEVNHKNGIKTDNRLENLEWCTHKHNMIHCIENNLRKTARGEKIPNSILNEEKVKEILKAKKQGVRNKVLAEKYNIDRSAICRISNGKSWAHVTL